jgi:hypothetical protein
MFLSSMITLYSLKYMSEIKVLLDKIAAKIGRTPEQLAGFLKILEDDNWLSTIDDLRALTPDFWEKNKFPLKLS